jgi:uncharacterized protein
MNTSTDISCSTCKALCCRLEARLIDDSDDQVPDEYVTLVDNFYAVMRRGEDGWCEALDRDTMLCKIYERRPFICREYQLADYDCLYEREKLVTYNS